MAGNYYENLSSAKALIPRRRRLDEISLHSFQRTLGIPAIAFGLIFIAVGIYGLAAG
jgi:hypothetical protein